MGCDDDVFTSELSGRLAPPEEVIAETSCHRGEMTQDFLQVTWNRSKGDSMKALKMRGGVLTGCDSEVRT